MDESKEEFFEVLVLDANVGFPKVMALELVADFNAGEALPVDQGPNEPVALVVFDLVVLLLGEAEGMGGGAVLVVDNLGVCALVEADIASLLDAVVTVGRGGDDGNMLPVVPVATTVDSLDRLVALKVVVVQVTAPVVAAASAHVDVVVIKVFNVAAPVRPRPLVIDCITNGDVAVLADGWHVVAAVLVTASKSASVTVALPLNLQVQGRLLLLFFFRAVLVESTWRIVALEELSV